jgi:hypothetical protein
MAAAVTIYLPALANPQLYLKNGPDGFFRPCNVAGVGNGNKLPFAIGQPMGPSIHSNCFAFSIYDVEDLDCTVPDSFAFMIFINGYGLDVLGCAAILRFQGLFQIKGGFTHKKHCSRLRGNIHLLSSEKSLGPARHRVFLQHAAVTRIRN